MVFREEFNNRILFTVKTNRSMNNRILFIVKTNRSMALHSFHRLAAYNAWLFSAYFTKNILLRSSPLPQDVTTQN